MISTGQSAAVHIQSRMQAKFPATFQGKFNFSRKNH